MDLDFEYKCAKQFYRDNEGKAFKLSYTEKLRFIALSKQVSRGPYSPEADNSADASYFDLVGNDRRAAWQQLGNLARQDAMLAFVSELKSACNTFDPWLQAHVKMEEERKKKESISLVESTTKAAAQHHDSLPGTPPHQSPQGGQTNPLTWQHAQQLEQQKALIKNALNAQTLQQFKQYALSRYPDDTKAQQSLIQELQEQHFQQYMQHIYYQQMAQMRGAASAPSSDMNSNSTETAAPGSKLIFDKDVQSETAASETGGAQKEGSTRQRPDSFVRFEDKQQQQQDDQNTPSDNLLIANPSMWTNVNTKEFKNLVKKDKNLLIKVGRGEMVTIRVPTHEDGSYLFWEFTTDTYDIGFGLYFEWTISPTNEITITAEEPSDDEDDEIVDSGNPHDVEKVQTREAKEGDKPAMDVIVPIYRRDSHIEVQAGSHEYPGQGTYLLKFDNTYSLFRGKTLYYRVYYTK